VSEEEKGAEKKPERPSDAEASDAGNPAAIGTLFQMEMDAVLRPVSEDTPAGKDLRYDNTYDLIREARREDDASLPQGVWERELKRADWEKVRDLCREAIENRSKDLQIAVWLMEALFHLNGFYGIREGLRIILALSQTFWDDMYPAIEDEDVEARISPLVWVNEKFAIQIKFQAITRPKTRDSAEYHFADWEQANILENLAVSDKKGFEEAEKKNKVTRAKFLSSVMFTSAAFYKHQHKDLSGALENLLALDNFLDEKCGNNGPSLLQLKKTVEEIHKLIGTFLKEKREVVETSPGTDESNKGDDSESTSYDYGKGDEMPSVALSIRSRAEAYRMLSEAADYLFIHEPHSPTPYLVRRGVSWGNMTLTELLQELVNDKQDLNLIFNLLGIRM